MTDSSPKFIRQSTETVDVYVERHPQLGLRGEVTPLLQAALRLTSNVPGLILDLGCGDGRTLASLKQDDGSRRLVGVDLSIQRALTAARRGFLTAVADAHVLPVETGSTALVTCRHVVEHVEDDLKMLIEVSRVLGEGGFLYLETPLRLKGAWYFYRNPKGQWMLDPTHQREYRRAEALEQILLQAGLTPILTETRPITYPIRHILYRAISRNRLPDQGQCDQLEEARLRVRVPRYRELQVIATPHS
jgi:ubiquinone/menaquinone biosynthesis C-methylase UbiE